MLTWADLQTHVANDELVRWTWNGKPPPADGRALYMVPNVCEEFQRAPWPGSDGERPQQTAERRAAMRQVLERYVRGKNLLIRRDIKELGSEPIRKHMRGYWEFRSQGRMEETRLFGFFARPGAFVATCFAGRGTFGAQEDWDARRKACEQIWLRIFPNHSWLKDPWPVLLKSNLENYLNSED